MARPIEDEGHRLVATKPLRLGQRVYDPSKLPDPVQCAGCAILVNARGDPNDLRVMVSTGSRWRALAFADEVQQGQTVVPQVDLAALAREQVALALRSLPQLAPQPVQLIESQPQQTSENGAALATAILEMSEHVNMLLSEYAKLKVRIDEIDKVKVLIEAAAA